MQKYKWLMATAAHSGYGIDAISFVAIPPLEELNEFIKEHVLSSYNTKVLLHSYHWTKEGKSVEGITESERGQVIELITKLYLQFHPWQFRAIVQANKSFEICWIENSNRLHKYKS